MTNKPDEGLTGPTSAPIPSNSLKPPQTDPGKTSTVGNSLRPNQTDEKVNISREKSLKPPEASFAANRKVVNTLKPVQAPRKPVKGAPGKSRSLKPDPPEPAKSGPEPITRSERWRQRRQRVAGPLRSLSMVAAGVVIAVAAMFAFSTLNPGPHVLTAGEVNDAIAKAMASATPPPPIAAQVYQAIQPSLVKITVHELDNQGQQQTARGTGVILDQQGQILTSLHVVKGAIDITVGFADGSTSNAMIAAQQPDKDIAVLRATQPPAQLVPATLGNPNFLHPGDDAIVVGNPFGLTNSVTAGHISGLNRTFQPPDNGQQISGLIQFDAAVNPGNSGGPLLDSAGEVVGIVTGLVNPTGQDVFIGIGFAVPIDTAASAAGSAPY